MEVKYLKIIETIVAELLTVYTAAIANSKDEYDYCAVVTSALVFKELALFDFKKVIIQNSDDDPNDICEAINNKAKEIAITISKRCLYVKHTLN